MSVPQYVLTISGSDSSGGAGMQADNRAILAAGAFPLNVITAVTVQTPEGVGAVEYLAADFVEQQMRALLSAYPVAAVKSGMLGKAEIVRCVVTVLADFPQIPYVLDPVLRSTSGHALLDAAGESLVRDALMPRATVTTPNLDELAVLAEGLVAAGVPVLEQAAVLAGKFGGSILVKGGHGAGACSEDWLVGPDGARQVFSGERIATGNTRGTGCVLSSAIAAGLAEGSPLPQAIRRAKALLSASLRAHADAAWTGSGPAFY